VSQTAVESPGCYVYALVRHDGRPLPAVTGVGGSELRIVTVPGSKVAAVVSDADALPERVRRTDLLAHSEVLQALVADRDVVPIRFGSVYPSDDEMCGELLAANAGPLQRLLAAVEAKVEMQVKIGYDEAAVTTEIVASDRHVRKMRDVVRVAPADNGARIELGRRFSAALDARRSEDARQATRRLERSCEAVTVSGGSGDFGVAKIACLVSRKKLRKLEEAIDRMADGQAGRMTFEVLGPLPPYSFVSGPIAEVG